MLKIHNIWVGILCAAASLSSLGIYFFGYAGGALSRESLFWAMPLICPIAFIVYLKTRTFGALTQSLLYALATYGAYHVVQEECSRGNCFTQNGIAIVMASMFSGVHMIAMLGALLLMCFGTAKAIRSHPA
jgi:hypothetical protein